MTITATQQHRTIKLHYALYEIDELQALSLSIDSLECAQASDTLLSLEIRDVKAVITV